MKELNELLQELGISKVRLAKYLGVSRQMVYNYLELDSIDKWPAEKKILLYKLFGIEDSMENPESLNEINVTTDFILQVEERLSDGIKDKKDNEYLDLKGLKKEEHNLVTELTLLIKDKLGEENNQENFYLMQYIYNMLQSVDKQPEIKYMLAYLSKLNCQIPVDSFKFDEEEQYIFEGIIHSAFTLFGNRGKASRSRIEESRNRLVEDVQEKKEEILSRTQQLTTVKFQALKELGYNSLTPENAVEVYEKISEITTRYNK